MSNEAYDFSMFETGMLSSAKPKIKEVKRPNIKPLEKKNTLTKQQKKKRKYTTILFVGCVLMMALCITSKLKNSELNTVYKEKSEELAQLKSMHVSLETQYAANVSADNIEDYAIEVLGMQMAQSSQIKHISLTNEDNCKLTTDKSELGILSSIKNIFS